MKYSDFWSIYTIIIESVIDIKIIKNVEKNMIIITHQYSNTFRNSSFYSQMPKDVAECFRHTGI